MVSTFSDIVDAIFRLKKVLRNSDALEARLRRELEIETRVGTANDGYPTNVTIGRSSSKGTKSPTERKVFSDRVKDQHAALTEDAIRSLALSVQALERCIDRLDAIDDLRKTEVAPVLCEACGLRKVEHRGTVGDRLNMSREFCDPCYRFVVQTAAPGTRKGRLPNEKEVTEHERTGRWKIRG